MTVIVVQTGFSYFFIESRIFPSIGKIVNSCGILLYDVLHYVNMYVGNKYNQFKNISGFVGFWKYFSKEVIP